MPLGHGGRRLHPDPDQRVEVKATACPDCQASIGESDQKLHAVYDKIELPRVTPIVTRVKLYAAACPCCGARFVAPAPAKPDRLFRRDRRAHQGP